MKGGYPGGPVPANAGPAPKPSAFTDSIGQRWETHVEPPAPEIIGPWMLTGNAPNRKLTRYDQWRDPVEFVWESEDTSYNDPFATKLAKARRKVRRQAWKAWMDAHGPAEVEAVMVKVLHPGRRSALRTQLFNAIQSASLAETNAVIHQIIKDLEGEDGE